MGAPAFDTPTVLLAMPDSPERARLARSLVERGDRVLLCSSPWTGAGSCPLIREAPCALVEIADVTVVSEEVPGSDAQGAPGLCALYARKSIAMGGGSIADLTGHIDDALAGNPRR